jgi:hypothetical protein
LGNALVGFYGFIVLLPVIIDMHRYFFTVSSDKLRAARMIIVGHGSAVGSATSAGCIYT